MRFAILLATIALSGCGEPAALAVDSAWVRLPAVPGRPAAAYFTVRGGTADATLIAVASSEARGAELHESMAGGMRPLSSVAVPAGTDLSFSPGGRHVMLFDVNPRMTPGKHLPLRFTFADGRQVDADARIVLAGDPAP